MKKTEFTMFQTSFRKDNTNFFSVTICVDAAQNSVNKSLIFSHI